MTTRYTVTIGWADANDTALDVTVHVLSLSIRRGMMDRMQHTAYPGTISLVLDNQSGNFSPSNTGGSYSPNVVPGRTIIVQVVDGGNTYDVFRGSVDSISPTAGKEGERLTYVTGRDLFGRLKDYKLTLPIQEDTTMQALSRLICSAAFRGDAANGYAVFKYVNPSDGDTLTVGDQTYTFKNTLGSDANQVLIGATGTDTSVNLTAAINADAEYIGTSFTSATMRHALVTAMSRDLDSPTTPDTPFVPDETGPYVKLTANASGTWGNSITLSKSGSWTLYAFSGGADEPDGLLDIDESERVISIAGDSWESGQTSALSALNDVVMSEFGYAWCAADGTITVKNKSWLFARPASAVSLEVGERADSLAGSSSVDAIYNHVEAGYTPRSEVALGVVAKSNSVISVPGGSGVVRWDANVTTPELGGTMVSLPFVDPDSGQAIGARQVITPVASTDYTVNDQSGGGGYDYTNSGRIKVSVAPKGDHVEVSFKNTATGTLYIRGFQVRGIGIYRFNSQNVTQEDTDSIESFGRRDMAVDMVLNADNALAESVAGYLIGRYADAKFRVTKVVFGTYADATVNGTNLFDLDIGDVITITDRQLGITSASKYVLLGISSTMTDGVTKQLAWDVLNLDDVTYWILGDATYGVLGSTTRLAL